jgi:hypothetical protein
MSEKGCIDIHPIAGYPKMMKNIKGNKEINK